MINCLKTTAETQSSGRIGVICNALLTIAQFLGLLALMIVSSLALLTTVHLAHIEGRIYSEKTELSTVLTAAGQHEAAASIVCAVFLLAILFLIWKCRIGSCKPWKLLVAVIVWAMIFQALWIHSLNASSFVFPDTLQLSNAANALLSGDMSAFHNELSLDDKGTAIDFSSANMSGPEGYFIMYPFQAGSLYVFACIYKLFGTNNFMAFQMANAVANALTIICLYWITCSLSASHKAQNLSIVLCGLCFPLFFSCTLVYGNSLGLLFSAAAIACTAHALRQASTKRCRLIFTALGFVSIALAMLMKSTCVLFLIVMVILMLIESARSRSVALCAITLVCALAAQQLSGMPTKILEGQTGGSFGDGMPKTSWIAMGLSNDNALEIPGWWSLFPYNAMIETNGDASEQSRIAVQSIGQSIKQFTSDPAYGAWFFGVKLASEWSNPAFQTLYYSSLCTESDEATQDYGKLANSVLFGNANPSATLFMDAFQLLIVIAAFSFTVSQLRRDKTQARKPITTLNALLPSVIALGFIVYLLWEAKAIYTLPFFVMMVPLAALQLDKLFGCLDKRLYQRQIQV